MNDTNLKALSGHTPGGWKASGYYVFKDGSPKQGVASTDGFTSDTKKAFANAALIAAAPELLAEVHALRHHILVMQDDATEKIAQRDKLAEALRVVITECYRQSEWLANNPDETHMLGPDYIAELAEPALEEVTK